MPTKTSARKFGFRGAGALASAVVTAGYEHLQRVKLRRNGYLVWSVSGALNLRLAQSLDRASGERVDIVLPETRMLSGDCWTFSTNGPVTVEWQSKEPDCGQDGRCCCPEAWPILQHQEDSQLVDWRREFRLENFSFPILCFILWFDEPVELERILLCDDRNGAVAEWHGAAQELTWRQCGRLPPPHTYLLPFSPYPFDVQRGEVINFSGYRSEWCFVLNVPDGTRAHMAAVSWNLAAHWGIRFGK